MSASSSPQLLYRIDECGDVMADACVCGEDGDLVFLSVWARDTAIQQFLARLTLGRDEDDALFRREGVGAACRLTGIVG